MKKWEELLSKPWAAYTFALCSAVLFYMLLSHVSAIAYVLHSFFTLISPIIIGAVVAYLLNPAANFFEKKLFKKMKKESSRHIFAVIMTLICFILFLALLLVALIPSLVQSVSKLVSNWSVYTSKLEAVIERVTAFAESRNISIDFSNMSSLVDNAMDRAMELLKNNTATIFDKVTTIGTSVSNFAIGIVFGFCFLAAKKTILNLLSALRGALLKKERIKRDDELLRRCHKVFIRYFGCTLLDALIVGIATLLFMLIMRLPYAPLIAMVVALTNIVPTFGPVIGGAIGIFFLILDKPLGALWFLIFIVVLQAIDGAIIKPRLFSGSLGIPGVWTLVLIILGGKVAGMLGILLAVPFAAIFIILYHETVVPRLEKRTDKINFKPEN